MNFLHKMRDKAESFFGGAQKPDKPESGLARFAKAIKNPKKAIYQARLDAKGRQEEVLGDAQRVSNEDVVMEQLAHAGAYGRLDPDRLQTMGYHEAGAVEDPESGFRAVLYMP